MSEVPVAEREPLVIVDTRDAKEISQAYQILGKYFHSSELESEEAIMDRTLGEQKEGVRHGVLVAYRGDRMVSCCIYDHFVDTEMVYVEYIATEVDERRQHVATELLQRGIFEQFSADILIDIVDPKKMEGATQQEVDSVTSKSRFWDRQGARKIGLRNFQQPDFEDDTKIDDGAFLAIIPCNPETTEIDSARMTETLLVINRECNGVENPEEKFVEMFEELKQTTTLEVSTRSLIKDVAPVEYSCQ